MLITLSYKKLICVLAKRQKSNYLPYNHTIILLNNSLQNLQ